MIDRHVGRLGHHAFILRFGAPSDTNERERYWEIADEAHYPGDQSAPKTRRMFPGSCAPQ